jgi:hypothetical protein
MLYFYAHDQASTISLDMPSKACRRETNRSSKMMNLPSSPLGLPHQLISAMTYTVETRKSKNQKVVPKTLIPR